MKGIFSRQCLWSAGVSSFTYQKWGTLCKISMFQYPMKRVPKKNNHARHRTTTLNPHEKNPKAIWLVVEPYPSEKIYLFVSWDDFSIPNCFWKVIKFHGSSHHQPAIIGNHPQGVCNGMILSKPLGSPGARATRKPVHPAANQVIEKVRDPEVRPWLFNVVYAVSISKSWSNLDDLGTQQPHFLDTSQLPRETMFHALLTWCLTYLLNMR